MTFLYLQTFQCLCGLMIKANATYVSNESESESAQVITTKRQPKYLFPSTPVEDQFLVATFFSGSEQVSTHSECT